MRMKSNSAIIALSILLNLAQHVASADDRSNSIDVKKLEAVCSDLLDKPFLSPRWDKLQPYLRTTQALKSVRVDAAAVAVVRLRFGAGFG